MALYDKPKIVVEPPGPKAREIIEKDESMLSPSLTRTAPLVGYKAEGVFVEDVDGSEDKKPEWNYLTLQQVELMVEFTSEFYYKALAFFLFDSGIRAPKELMNVRVKDLTPIADSNLIHLQIREDTSKTFGRKIKLMICSDMIKKYIEMYDL